MTGLTKPVVFDFEAAWQRHDLRSIPFLRRDHARFQNKPHPTDMKYLDAIFHAHNSAIDLLMSDATHALVP